MYQTLAKLFIFFSAIYCHQAVTLTAELVSTENLRNDASIAINGNYIAFWSSNDDLVFIDNSTESIILSENE